MTFINNCNPVKVFQTNTWKKLLTKQISDFKILNPIIVTSSGNKNRLNLDSIFNPDSIFCLSKSNPTFDDCHEIMNFTKTNSFDGVISIGGGSVMDLAKVVISYISNKDFTLTELICFKGQYENVVPSVFIPTTHGTGSEVTMWGTIWDMKENKKYSISNAKLYPSVAILDGSTTLSLPLEISIATTMDALAHSFEVIWNKNQNKNSIKIALKSISLILKNAPVIKTDLFNLEARNKLLYASNLAGIAFSQTKTAAAHSISYPLTIRYGIPHGIAVFFSLEPLMDLNRKFIEDKLQPLLQRLNIDFDGLKNYVKSVPEGVFNLNLKKWGVENKDLAKIATESFNSSRIQNNIFSLSFEDVLNILKTNYEK